MRIIALMCLLIVIVLSGTALAQDTVLIPLSIRYRSHLIWSSDSRFFVFDFLDRDTDETHWQQLDVATRSVTLHNDFPLDVTLTNEELAVLAPYLPSQIVRASPDGQLLLFTARFGNSLDDNHYAIANRTTGEVFETDISTLSMQLDTLEVGPILWSSDSKALAINVISESGLVLVFHVSIPDPLNLTTVVVTRYLGIGEDRLYDTGTLRRNGLKAINPTGERVLLFGSDPDNYLITHLIEWYPQNSESTHALRVVSNSQTDDAITDPFFSPVGNNEILYWKLIAESDPTSGALYLYNPDTFSEVLVWQPSSPVVLVNFSPDGNWGIVEDLQGNVYLFDILSILVR